MSRQLLIADGHCHLPTEVRVSTLGYSCTITPVGTKKYKHLQFNKILYGLCYRIQNSILEQNVECESDVITNDWRLS